MFRTSHLQRSAEHEFDPGWADAGSAITPPAPLHAQPDLGDMRTHDIALSHLNARGFIQFHPLLAQRLDDFKAAIFLGHALYWSKHLAQTQPQRKGWFFMSAAQWTQATGLSTREQVSVRSALVSRGLILEALAGRPAVLHFKVNLEATSKLLGQPTLTWASMTELFRSCIRFYKPLSDICGSVSAGLYLSYLLQRQSFALRNPHIEGSTVELFPGEFIYRPEQARIALCLGVKAQRNARDKLKAAGFVREGRSSQEVVATRVNLAAIASCLQAQGERSIRKQRAPGSRSTHQVPLDLALVPGTGTQPQATAATLIRAGANLPQRQLNLFTSMGLISQWPAQQVPENRLAPQDDAATFSTPDAAAMSTPVGLLMSLFTAGQVERLQTHKAAADPSVLPQSNGADVTSTELSTDPVTPCNPVALLSNAICPFVKPNLPFCRNYIEQGISRYFQTTTTRPVDNLAGMETGRRRRDENQEIRNTETANNQKIDAEAPNRAFADVFECGGGVGSQDVEKRTVAPEFQTTHSAETESLTPGQQLALPDLLDASLHASVLSTVAKAPGELRQAFLDELAGHLAIPTKKIHNPAGWLHSLIRRHADGFVALAMAPQVADLRARRQRHQDRMANVANAPAHPVPQASNIQTGADETAAVDSEVKRVNRQRLLELAAAFSARRGGQR